MKNKRCFFFAQQCLCLINDSFGEKCDQGHARSIYFKQPLTHPVAGLNTCSSLFLLSSELYFGVQHSSESAALSEPAEQTCLLHPSVYTSRIFYRQVDVSHSFTVK